MVVEMTQPRYPRKRIKTWLNVIFIAAFLFLCCSVVYSFYLIRNIKLEIDLPAKEPLQIFEPEPKFSIPEQVRQKNPCLDLELQKDVMESANKKLILHYRNKLDSFLADLAFEVEISKDGKIPVKRIADLVKKHDNTQRKIYNKVHP